MMYGLQKMKTLVNCRKQFIYRLLDTKFQFHPGRRKCDIICVRNYSGRNLSAPYLSHGRQKYNIICVRGYFVRNLPASQPSEDREDLKIKSKKLGHSKTVLIQNGNPPDNSENTHFRSVLKSDPVYDQFLANLDQPDKCISIQDVIKKITRGNLKTTAQQFGLLQDIALLSFESKKMIFHEKLVWNILEDFTHKLAKMSHDQFLLAMKSYGSLEIRDIEEHASNVLKHIFLKIRAQFGYECVKRVRSWDVGTMLMAADLIFTMHHKYYRNYNYEHVFWPRIETLLGENKVEDHTAIAVLFHANIARQMSWNLRDILINKFLNDISLNLSVDECALVCAGFHKSNHPVKSNRFICEMIMTMKNNIHKTNEISICAVFKAFSRTFDKGISGQCPEIYSLLTDFTDVIAGEFDRLSYLSLVRIVKFYHQILLSSRKLETAFINRVKQIDFHESRSKDSSKTCFLMGSLLLDFEGIEDVMKSIKTQLLQPHVTKENDEEYDLHNLVRCLVGMSYLNHYPEDLLDKCFSKYSMGDLGEVRSDTENMLYLLHECVRIERPNHKVKLLPDMVYNCLKQKKMTLVATTKDNRGKFLTKLCLELGKMFGDPKYSNISFLLPHFELADIEMYIDAKKVPVKKSNSDQKRVVICVHGNNSFYRVKQDDGSFVLKLGGRYKIRQRQLEKTFCDVIAISEIDYHRADNPRQYLLEQLSGKVNTDSVKEDDTSEMLLDFLNSRKTKRNKID